MAVITMPGMLLEGDHASRPAATAVGGGTLYACSDHSLIYQSDTSSWTTWFDGTGSVSPTFSGARVFHNADQALTAGVDFTLAFNQERYDVSGYHDNATNNSRLIPPTTGKYHIGGSVSFTASATGWFGLWIRVAGSTKIAQIRGHIEDGSNVASLVVSTDYALTATTDYVELMAISSVASKNALVLGNYSCEFWCHLIGV